MATAVRISLTTSSLGKIPGGENNIHKKRGDLFIKPLSISNKQILSSLESSMRANVGANVTALREVVSIPSTALNSVPTQSLGYISALGVPAAGLRMRS